MVDLWHLTNINWLKELPDSEAETLRQGAKLRHYKVGGVIFEPRPKPEFVFLLESGLVRMYRSSQNGEEVTFGYVGAGEVFGELVAFIDRPRESYAVAVEPSMVLILEREAFAAAIQSVPSIMFSVAKQIEGRFHNIESRVEDLVFRDARSRVASAIVKLAKDFGQAEDGRLVIQLRLTHAELATLVGASRPTVSIALGELEDENILDRSRGRIVIVDDVRLRQAAQ